MASNMKKGNEDLLRIMMFAESDSVGNQAFFGLKGIGKTSLFQQYFSKKKRAEIALQYRKLFVFSQLDSRKSGTDLYQFLLDQVKMGILEIPNADDKKEIREMLPEIDDFFESPEGRLNQYLTLIKDKGYDLVIIMDHFHCMERDTDIGKEQYDVLRSINEQKLITFWIITDTDLLDTCASQEFIASFFAQKFTSKLTIHPGCGEKLNELTEYFAELKKVSLDDEEIRLIQDISAGVPTLIGMLVDLVSNLKREGTEVTHEQLEESLLDSEGGRSLFAGWMMGLNERKKELLYITAQSPDGILYEQDVPNEMSKLADIADEVGRGLLHVEKSEAGKTWTMTVPVFAKYVIRYHDKAEIVVEKEEKIDVPVPQVTSVNNYIFHQGSQFVQNQTNNIVNIENAISGLEDLQRLFGNNNALPDSRLAAQKLQSLPFQDDAWFEMDAEQQEEELEQYADGIFASELFAQGTLTEKQMEDFCLTEEILQQLSHDCRTQIVCGIQVYDLIQRCIDNFGLSMKDSESPRGILFARAFERHLKDLMAPAFCTVSEFAEQTLPLARKRVKFADFPIDRTTIGSYVQMLKFKKSYEKLAEITSGKLGYRDKDREWWNAFTKHLKEICDLRNDCCHSGTMFDNEQLMSLKAKIFDEGALADILLFKEITNRV